MTLLVVAALAFGCLALTWVAYPLAMRVLAGRAAVPTVSNSAPTELVCVVVATRDDAAAVKARVVDLRASDYPGHRLRIVVAVDRLSPHPIDDYRATLGDLAEVVPGDAPGGKAANLNAGVRKAGETDVLVFADVGQEFSRQAIRRLVEALRDDRLGGVAGRYTQHRGDAVMAAFAGFEAVIRRGQANSHSVVSTSGSIYAIRAPLWRELPAGLICDDLYTTLSIVQQGKRVGFCDEAVAYDPRSFTRDEQFARRVRTLTGLIQYCALRPSILLPWSNPVWSHFMLHKVLRLLTPIPLVIGTAALAAWMALRAPWLFAWGAMAIAVLILGGLVAAPGAVRRGAGQLRWILRLLLVPGLAIANGLRRRWTVWTPTPQGTRDHASAGVGR